MVTLLAAAGGLGLDIVGLVVWCCRRRRRSRAWWSPVTAVGLAEGGGSSW
jgi:hypothetical protein